MPWGRLDDSLYDHPKLDALGRNRLSCIGLNILAVSWCNRFLTDGFVPENRVVHLGGTRLLAESLVSAGLWERADGGYRIHDFLDYNESREDIQKDRERSRERMRLLRSSREQGANVLLNIARSSDDVQEPRARGRPGPVPSLPNPSSADVPPNTAPAREAAPPTIRCDDYLGHQLTGHRQIPGVGWKCLICEKVEAENGPRLRDIVPFPGDEDRPW